MGSSKAEAWLETATLSQNGYGGCSDIYIYIYIYETTHKFITASRICVINAIWSQTRFISCALQWSKAPSRHPLRWWLCQDPSQNCAEAQRKRITKHNQMGPVGASGQAFVCGWPFGKIPCEKYSTLHTLLMSCKRLHTIFESKVLRNQCANTCAAFAIDTPCMSQAYTIPVPEIVKYWQILCNE